MKKKFYLALPLLLTMAALSGCQNQISSETTSESTPSSSVEVVSSNTSIESSSTVKDSTSTISNESSSELSSEVDSTIISSDSSVDTPVSSIETVEPVLELLQESIEIEITDTIKPIEYVSRALDSKSQDAKGLIKFELPEHVTNTDGTLSFDQGGTYEIVLVLEDVSGTIKKTLTVIVNVPVVVDTNAPTIEGVKDLLIKPNTTINLLDGITATDDIDLDVTSSLEAYVDGVKSETNEFKIVHETEEEYYHEFVVTVKAKDSSDNVSEKRYTITVSNRAVDFYVDLTKDKVQKEYNIDTLEESSEKYGSSYTKAITGKVGEKRLYSGLKVDYKDVTTNLNNYTLAFVVKGENLVSDNIAIQLIKDGVATTSQGSIVLVEDNVRGINVIQKENGWYSVRVTMSKVFASEITDGTLQYDYIRLGFANNDITAPAKLYVSNVKIGESLEEDLRVNPEDSDLSNSLLPINSTISPNRDIHTEDSTKSSMISVDDSTSEKFIRTKFETSNIDLQTNNLVMYVLPGENATNRLDLKVCSDTNCKTRVISSDPYIKLGDSTSYSDGLFAEEVDINGTTWYKVTFSAPEYTDAEIGSIRISLGLNELAAGNFYIDSMDLVRYKDRLAAPTLTLTDNVVSWSAIEHANSYNVYINDTLASTQTNLTYTLSNLETGKYTITVEAVDTLNEYRVSHLSEPVSYTEGAVVIEHPEATDLTNSLTVAFSVTLSDSTGVTYGGEKSIKVTAEAERDGAVFLNFTEDMITNMVDKKVTFYVNGGSLSSNYASVLITCYDSTHSTKINGGKTKGYLEFGKSHSGNTADVTTEKVTKDGVEWIKVTIDLEKTFTEFGGEHTLQELSRMRIQFSSTFSAGNYLFVDSMSID